MSKKPKAKILFKRIKYSGERVQLDYVEKYDDYFISSQIFNDFLIFLAKGFVLLF
jgi:hypothetical protein